MHMGKAWLIAAAVVALTAACGPGAQAPVGGDVQGGDTAAAKPKPGGILNARITADPYDWDITISGKDVGGGQEMTNLTGESLLQFKSGPGIGYNEKIIDGELADKWEVSPDGKRYTFHLRPGVKWPNIPPVNGREFTSADVKFSIEYQTRSGEIKDKKLPPGQYDWMFEGLDSIDTPDPYTVVLNFKQPFAPFINYAASDNTVIFPREIYDKEGNFSNRYIGLGPWQWDEAATQVGSRFVFKRNTNYRQPGLPYLDEVRWLIIKDQGTAEAAYQTKQIDFLYEAMGPGEAAGVAAKVPGSQLFENYRSAADWRWYINTEKAPLNDVRVRKAISLGIDRDNFLNTLGEGKGKMNLEGLQPGYFTDEEIRGLLKYDPEQAARLLKEAGYDGTPVEMTYPGTTYGDIYVSGLQLLQAQLKKVGFNIALKSVDKNDFSNNRRDGNYYLGLQQSNTAQGDIDSWVYGGLKSGSKFNYNRVKDPKIDQLLEAQRREVDQDKRREIVRELYRYMIDQAYSVPIGNIAKYQVWQPYVKGYAPNELPRGVHVTEVWLDK